MPLEPEEALNFLEMVTEKSSNDCKKLLSHIGCNPLVLKQAANYIKYTRLEVEEYLANLMSTNTIANPIARIGDVFDRFNPGALALFYHALHLTGTIDSTQPTKDAYVDLLLRLLKSPSVKSDSSLVKILKNQVKELMDQEIQVLTSKQKNSYQWTQKLLVDQEVSQFVAENLQEMHALDEGKRPPDTKHGANIQKAAYEFENSEVVIHAFEPGTPLPQPPQGGIQIGLKNFGNTCWLNSLLKFIACTTFYDQMLTDPPPAGKEMLQGLLQKIIISLRTGKEPGNFLNAFLKEINVAIPTFRIGVQQDAPELLLNLINLLKWKPTYVQGIDAEPFYKSSIYPQLGMMYKPREAMPVG